MNIMWSGMPSFSAMCAGAKLGGLAIIASAMNGALSPTRTVSVRLESISDLLTHLGVHVVGLVVCSINTSAPHTLKHLVHLRTATTNLSAFDGIDVRN